MGQVICSLWVPAWGSYMGPGIRYLVACGPLIYPVSVLSGGGAYALALHPWNESVLRSVPLAHEHGISPLTPLLGQVFDAHTVAENWFAG